MVVNHGRGHGDQPVTCEPQPPAQVDLLEVHEEIQVQQADLANRLRAHQHRRPAGPEKVRGGVVLPAVGFDLVEEASAAEGVSQAVDVTPGGAAVIEGRGAGRGQQLGLAGGDGGVGVRGRDQRQEPVGGHPRIVVEQHRVLGPGFLEAAVAGVAETAVALVAQDFNAGKAGPGLLQTGAAAAVVDDDHAQGPAAVGEQGLEAVGEHRRPEMGDYDGDRFAHIQVCRPG